MIITKRIQISLLRYGEKYIGVELFELISSDNQNILMSKEEIKLGIKNIPHLRDKREKLGTDLLYENEELALSLLRE